MKLSTHQGYFILILLKPSNLSYCKTEIDVWTLDWCNQEWGAMNNLQALLIAVFNP
jgi:hypothetical protein